MCYISIYIYKVADLQPDLLIKADTATRQTDQQHENQH